MHPEHARSFTVLQRLIASHEYNFSRALQPQATPQPITLQDHPNYGLGKTCSGKEHFSCEAHCSNICNRFTSSKLSFLCLRQCRCRSVLPRIGNFQVLQTPELTRKVVPAQPFSRRPMEEEVMTDLDSKRLAWFDRNEEYFLTGEDRPSHSKKQINI